MSIRWAMFQKFGGNSLGGPTHSLALPLKRGLKSPEHIWKAFHIFTFPMRKKETAVVSQGPSHRHAWLEFIKRIGRCSYQNKHAQKHLVLVGQMQIDALPVNILVWLWRINWMIYFGKCMPREIWDTCTCTDLYLCVEASSISTTCFGVDSMCC